MSGSAFSSSQLLNQFLQDEGFLLRCSSTFDWDALLHRCTLIVEIFTTSILDRYEDNHKKIQQSAKRQLMRTDQWLNTPLHMACYNRARYDVVEALLEAASAADVNLLECRTWKNDRATPLLTACSVGASHRIVQLLVHSPGGDLAGGRAVRMADAKGRTPLTELCERYSVARLARQHRRNSPALRDVDMMDSSSHSQLFQNFWDSANHLLRGAWTFERPGESVISILHAMALVAECCPTDLADLLLRTNLHMVAFASRRGVFPIHLAVSTRHREHSELQVRQRAHIVSKLCTLYPAAASKPCPASGRTPFCEAVASGLSWPILEILLRHQPDAMYARDLKSHLYPFLLAASVSDMEETTQVDTIYHLLQRHPHILQSLSLVPHS